MRKWQKIQQKIDSEISLDSTTEAIEDPEHRLHIVQELHRSIDLQLTEMEKHPHVEESKVAELKRKKLQLKD
jgi:hypothetical protein